MREIPGWGSGFARCAAESEEPDQWRGLAGCWAPFLGHQGVRLPDISGFNAHGTLTLMDPTTDYIQSTKGYRVLDFDGTDDFVLLGNVLRITGALSIRAVVNFDVINTFQTILAKGGGASNKHFNLYSASSGVLVLDVSGDGINEVGLTLTNTAGVWQDVCAVYQPSTYMRLFLNGFQGAELTTSIPASMINSTQETRIGSRNTNNTGVLWWLNGQLALLEVYTRALQPNEVFRKATDPLAMYRVRSRRVFRAAAVAAAATSLVIPTNSMRDVMVL